MSRKTGNIEIEELLMKENYLKVINTFIDNLMSMESVDEISCCVERNVISKLNYGESALFLLDEDKNHLIKVSNFNTVKGLAQTFKDVIIQTPKKSSGIIGRVFDSGVGLIIHDTIEDPRCFKDSISSSARSRMVVPITSNGRVIGIIDSGHSNKNFFGEVDFKVMTTVSHMISIKLENAITNKRTKDSLERKILEKTKALEKTNEALRIQNKEKEILIKEIHHRVKNNMQIIISMLNMQIASARTEREEAVFKECMDRMYAISNIHDILYFEKDVLKIPIEEFLKGLTSTLVFSYLPKQSIDLALDINVEAVTLDIGIPIGLIINELIINSFKKGFDQSVKGFVNIEMIETPNNFVITYRDNSLTVEPDDLEDPFFGLSLVNLLVEQLDGQLVVDYSNGLRLELNLPAA